MAGPSEARAAVRAVTFDGLQAQVRRHISVRKAEARHAEGMTVTKTASAARTSIVSPMRAERGRARSAGAGKAERGGGKSRVGRACTSSAWWRRRRACRRCARAYMARLSEREGSG